MFPIEVGCRGFPATSLRYFLQKVGLDPKHLKKATKEIALAADTSSRWLLLKRANSEAYRLRGETLVNPRHLLTMQRGPQQCGCSAHLLTVEYHHKDTISK
ncbi:unnamed protein product [Leuciscus chuanchicus]